MRPDDGDIGKAIRSKAFLDKVDAAKLTKAKCYTGSRAEVFKIGFPQSGNVRGHINSQKAVVINQPCTRRRRIHPGHQFEFRNLGRIAYETGRHAAHRTALK